MHVDDWRSLMDDVMEMCTMEINEGSSSCDKDPSARQDILYNTFSFAPKPKVSTMTPPKGAFGFDDVPMDMEAWRQMSKVVGGGERVAVEDV
ncbi:hypothetical protein Q3G72_033317 [Acer saccharum]|nr:hypothetical protein Q3G72_033317 [Acer saccharum]